MGGRWGTRTSASALVPIYGVTLVDVLGTMIMVPLLPYLAQRYGASGLVVGTILTTSGVAGVIAAPIWGSVSDRLGRKRVVLIAQCISLLGYIALALSHSLALIFVARAVAGFGSGGIGVTQSYIADVTAEQDRDRAYALFGAVFGIGIVLGPVLGGGLIRFGFAAPFAAAALIEFVTIVLTLRFLPQPPRRAGRTPSLREAARIVARDSAVRSLVVRHTLFIFAVTSFFAVFSLYLSRELNVGPALAALVVAYVALTFVRELGPFGAALGVAPVVGGEAIDLNPHFAGIVPAAAVALAFAIGVARMRYTGDA